MYEGFGVVGRPWIGRDLVGCQPGPPCGGCGSWVVGRGAAAWGVGRGPWLFIAIAVRVVTHAIVQATSTGVSHAAPCTPVTIRYRTSMRKKKFILKFSIFPQLAPGGAEGFPRPPVGESFFGRESAALAVVFFPVGSGSMSSTMAGWMGYGWTKRVVKVAVATACMVIFAWGSVSLPVVSGPSAEGLVSAPLPVAYNVG